MSSDPFILPDDVRKQTFVVIPAYNEGSCLADVVSEVRAIYPNVVVVDDGSTDDTYAAAQRTAAFVLRHAVNRGQGAALQTGLTFALRRGARYVVTFDADGQHDPRDIDALLSPICAGECDIVLGSRFLGEAIDLPFSRRVLLRIAVLLTRLVNGLSVTDAHNGLRAFSRKAAERIDIRLDRMAHASELLDFVAASGLPWKEASVTVRYTPYSLSKGQSHRGALRILLHYIVGRIVR